MDSGVRIVWNFMIGTGVKARVVNIAYKRLPKIDGSGAGKCFGVVITGLSINCWEL